MRALVIGSVLATILTGTMACSSKMGGGDGDDAGGDDGPLPEPAWTIDVDMSGLDRFVPSGTATWAVGGTVTSSEPLAGVDVAGAAVTVDGSGAFTADVAVLPGLTPVTILARDTKDHARKADRTLLSARFLQEGNHNPAAAAMVLNDAIVATMGEACASPSCRASARPPTSPPMPAAASCT